MFNPDNSLPPSNKITSNTNASSTSGKIPVRNLTNVKKEFKQILDDSEGDEMEAAALPKEGPFIEDVDVAKSTTIPPKNKQSLFDLSAQSGSVRKAYVQTPTPELKESDVVQEDFDSSEEVFVAENEKFGTRPAFIHEQPDLSYVNPNGIQTQNVQIQQPVPTPLHAASKQIPPSETPPEVIVNQLPREINLQKPVNIASNKPKPFNLGTTTQPSIEEKLFREENPQLRPIVSAADKPHAQHLPNPQLAPIDISIAKTETPVPASDQAKVVAQIQEIVDQIVDRIYTLKTGNQTETIITLKHPPLFEGVNVTLTSYATAKGELNITFSNLTQAAKNIIDLRMSQESLKTTLEQSGIVVHMITTTTQNEIKPIIVADNSSREQLSQRQDDTNGQGKQQKKRG